jgi:quinol-cytochrome oxidoreductase complex cytochrome b subunit
VATAYKYPRELTWIIGVAIRAAVASGMRIMWVAEN